MNQAECLKARCAQVSQRIKAEPFYDIILYKILDYCKTSRPLNAIEKTVRAFPEMKNSWESPQVLLSWLIESGGIEQLSDEKGETVWQITQAGLKVLSSEKNSNKLKDLLTQEGKYQEIYLQVLNFCSTPKSRTEIEVMLKGNSRLENPKVYASFFLDKLENAGAITWNEKWETTEAGGKMTHLLI